MFTKKIFWAVLMVMCAITAGVNAQDANGTLRQKYELLAKDADAHPSDWQKQYVVAQMLLDKDSELYDQVGAGKYFERIYHVVADLNTAVPDSVFNEAGITLMFNAMNQQDIQNAMFYGDELKRYVRLKNDTESTMPMMVNTMAVLIQMMMERPMAAADQLSDIRKELLTRQFQGVENTDITMAVLYEQVLESYKEFAEGKLMEIIIDGKPYVLIAKGEWNVEKPFMGWMTDKSDDKSVFFGEDGRVL